MKDKDISIKIDFGGFPKITNFLHALYTKGQIAKE